MKSQNYLYLLLTIVLSTESFAKLKLEDAIYHALSNNKEIQSVNAKLISAEGLQDQVRAAMFPQVEFTGTAAPLYDSQGNALKSERNLYKWGPWLQGQLKVIEPLYTFGKISAFKDAANYNYEATKFEISQNTALIVYEIKKYYYSYLLAKDLFEFISQVSSDVEKAYDEANKKNEAGKGKKRDVLRLDVYKNQVDIMKEEAQKGQTLAKMAFLLKAGFTPTENIEVEGASLEKIEKTETDLFKYIDDGLKDRPEINRLQNGIKAKEKLAYAESVGKYPTIFAGILASSGWTNVRQKQTSDFAYDPYNSTSAGIGFGIKWDWAYGSSTAKSKILMGEKIELEKKLDFAKLGIETEIRKAYEDLKFNDKKVSLTKKALKAADKWVALDATGYSIGTVDSKDFVEAYLAKAKALKEYKEAIFDYNLSWAELDRVTQK